MKISKKISVILIISLLMSYFYQIIAFATTENNKPKEMSENKEIFFDDFSGDSLDTSKWLIAEKAWGGNNGGVVPENVSVSDGLLKLEGHGDKYKGEVSGVNREDGTRTGAAIATREYFGSGSYEVRAKVGQELGACSAIWTFEYEEYYPGQEGYKGTGSYYAVNHEIDIEMPGRPASKHENISYEYALCNTWIGEKGSEYTASHTKLPKVQNDGQFHTYRFDWHTGDDGIEPHVDFYFDGELVTTNTTHVPTNAGRLWLGLWFPNGWAGTPDFDTSVFEIDYVKITPFHEKGDTPQKETYGKDGWAVDSFPEDNEKEHYNHIINGDFSEGEKGWTLNGDAKIQDENCILTSGSKTDTISQTISVEPRMTYVMTADVVTDGTAVTIGAKKLNGTGNQSVTVTESGKVELTFVTEKSVKEMKAYAEVLRYQEKNSEVKIDNITLYSKIPTSHKFKQKEITFEKSVGTCGFIDDPINVLEAVGTVREYHNYRWITEKANECRFTQGTWWNWDDYYKKLNEAGIDPVPCIQGTSQADRKGYNGNKQQKPIDTDEDSLKPESYKEHAQTMYQFAARYGNQKVDESKLLLESGQTKESGLGYIEYYENWNEPDKTWEGEESHFSGAEMAAMCSADYDGDEGRIGNTYGIKNADPDAKLVMGGVANNSGYIAYLNDMKKWAEENRNDKEIPVDVLNYHMYVGKNAPEDSDFIKRCEELVAWRNENAQGREIWITEFGYDTNEGSPHGVSESKQRDYLMRTYLIANAHGIDRATMYMSRDAASSNSTGKYATSGLTTEKNKWVKKSSWYGTSTLKNVLTGYTFKEILQESNDIFAYKFVNNETNEECYVIWTPTGNGSKIDDCQMNIGSGKEATLTTFKEKSTEGETTNLTIENGIITVSVPETPIFIKVKDSEEPEIKPLTFKVALDSDKQELKAGETVTITAKISEINKNDFKGLLAISAKLDYDKNVLEIDPESFEGLGDWRFSENDYNPENLKLITDTSSSKFVTTPGDIFKITFKVKEDIKPQETTIKLTSIEGGTGELVNGTVKTDEAKTTIKIIEEKEPEILKGDVDGNGEIGINDLAKLKLHYIEKELLQGKYLEAGDMDNDGEITINDIAVLKKVLIGKM